MPSRRFAPSDKPQRTRLVYKAQGRYADAEPPFERSLAIREKALGPDHPDVSTSYFEPGGDSSSSGLFLIRELYQRRRRCSRSRLGGR